MSFPANEKNGPDQGDRKGAPLLYYGAYDASFTYIGLTQGDRKGTPLLYYGAYDTSFTYIVGAGLAPALLSFAVDLEEVVSLVGSLHFN